MLKTQRKITFYNNCDTGEEMAEAQESEGKE